MAEKDDNITYKVTDRRLFNPDGTLREVEREEAPEPTPAPPPAAPRAEAATPPPAEAPRVSDAQASARREPAPGAPPRAVPEAPEFLNFIYGLATNAFANLGVMPNPMTGEATVDLETAKHFIDILGALETKTRGNLNAQEQQLLTEALRDLRLQYVSLLNASTKTQAPNK